MEHKKTKLSPFLVRLFVLLLAFLIISLLFLYACTDVFQTLFSGKSPDFRSKPSLSYVSDTTAKTVILDAGHGGYDSGARSESGILEKDINLAVTQKVKSFLSLYGINAILTRSEDDVPHGAEANTRKRSELLSRVKIAQNTPHDLFLSIHMNAFPLSDYSGAQLFYTERNLQNEVLAATLQKNVASLLQINNKRLPKKTSSVFILERISTPAALIECGFLSNAQEASMLADEDYQNKLAFTIATGIASYLGEKHPS